MPTEVSRDIGLSIFMGLMSFASFAAHWGGEDAAWTSLIKFLSSNLVHFLSHAEQ